MIENLANQLATQLGTMFGIKGKMINVEQKEK